jgi:hypothetical protein
MVIRRIGKKINANSAGLTHSLNLDAESDLDMQSILLYDLRSRHLK